MARARERVLQPAPARRARLRRPALAGPAARPGTVVQGGRAKAYRPLPELERRSAWNRGLAAYERGDYFAAHELLEPAWMGTDHEAERNLYQGVIKLAAAYVHAVRGNAAGARTNLVGARARLAEVVAAGGPDGGLDLPTLVGAIDDRLERLAGLAPVGPRRPGSARFPAGATPVPIDPPPLTRRKR